MRFSFPVLVIYDPSPFRQKQIKFYGLKEWMTQQYVHNKEIIKFLACGFQKPMILSINDRYEKIFFLLLPSCPLMFNTY